MLYDVKFKVKDWYCDGVWGLFELGIIGVMFVEIGFFVKIFKFWCN